jgi:Domain of unknown function (DUF5666)
MRLVPALAATLALAAAGAALAQQPPTGQRLTGVVKAASATSLTLTTAKGDETVALTPQTRVMARQAASAADIKAGAYLGTSNQTAADGASGTATEVHLMDNGPNVHFPMNQAGLMMTNGHVKSVAKTAKGEEMDVDYGQAQTRHVVITKDTSLTKMVDATPEALRPGVAVMANAAPGADGKLTATFVVIGAAPAAK